MLTSGTRHDGLRRVHRLPLFLEIFKKITMAARLHNLLTAFSILALFGTIKLDNKISDVVFNPPKESVLMEPTVLLAVIARNAEHLLPNWLGYIELLDYPKNRMSIW